MKSCPMFIDNTRECIKEIEFLPSNTLDFCLNSKFADCPFYKIIKKEKVCENISKCPMFRHFEVQQFDAFVRISNAFCTSKNYPKCQRYQLKKSGQKVPDDLMPDGKFIGEE